MAQLCTVTATMSPVASEKSEQLGFHKDVASVLLQAAALPFSVWFVWAGLFSMMCLVFAIPLASHLTANTENVFVNHN